MIDVHHIKAHFFGKKRIVFGDFLHFAYQCASQRLYFKRIVFVIIEIFGNNGHGIFLIDRLSNAEALDGRNKNVYAAVGQVDFFYNACRRSYAVQIRNGRIFGIVFKHDDSDKSVFGVGAFDNLRIFGRIDHKRRKNTGKNRAPRKRNDAQFVRKRLVRRHNGLICHIEKLL